MADNVLTSGEYATSGEGENSSNKKPSAYKAEQLALKQQEKAKGAVKDAAKAAALAKTAAPGNNPYNSGTTRTSIATTSNVHGQPPLNVPKRGRGK